MRSKDGRQLIGIDAGTRADSARAAYEALRRHAPDLPALTHVLVTHSHRDHVGGHAFFRSLEPRPRFYARENYRAELDRELGAPSVFSANFFGSRFDVEAVKSFEPDELVGGARRLDIGGTRFELIPAAGGETEDALLIHRPELGVLCVAGDDRSGHRQGPARAAPRPRAAHPAVGRRPGAARLARAAGAAPRSTRRT